METFPPAVDRAFSLLDQNVCSRHPEGETFLIVETKKEGHFELTVCAHGPCIHIRTLDQHNATVFAEKQCADDLVFLYDCAKRQWTAHIFELKRSIDAKKWEKTILHQFNGALMQTYAIAGFLRIDALSGVIFHCAYHRNRSEAAIPELKQFSGEPARADWLYDPVTLPSFPDERFAQIPFQVDGSYRGTMPPLGV